MATLARLPVYLLWLVSWQEGKVTHPGPLALSLWGLGHPAFAILPLLAFVPIRVRRWFVSTGRSGAPFLLSSGEHSRWMGRPQCYSRRGVQWRPYSQWPTWVSFLSPVVSIPRWGPAGWRCSPWALLVVVGVFVLIGDSGGWRPAVRACGGGLYAHIPQKGRGKVGRGGPG